MSGVGPGRAVEAVSSGGVERRGAVVVEVRRCVGGCLGVVRCCRSSRRGQIASDTATHNSILAAEAVFAEELRWAVAVAQTPVFGMVAAGADCTAAAGGRRDIIVSRTAPKRSSGAATISAQAMATSCAKGVAGTSRRDSYGKGDILILATLSTLAIGHLLAYEPCRTITAGLAAAGRLCLILAQLLRIVRIVRRISSCDWLRVELIRTTVTNSWTNGHTEKS